jgi:hypothetical protein
MSKAVTPLSVQPIQHCENQRKEHEDCAVYDAVFIVVLHSSAFFAIRRMSFCKRAPVAIRPERAPEQRRAQNDHVRAG